MSKFRILENPDWQFESLENPDCQDMEDLRIHADLAVTISKSLRNLARLSTFESLNNLECQNL